MVESGGSVALICKTNDSDRIKNDSRLSRKCHANFALRSGEAEKNGEETLKRAEPSFWWSL